jgi:predicted  nucleic acid-binding Zn-ribbon protein
MKVRILKVILLSVLATAGTAHADPQVGQTRNTLEKWVETRQIISKEKADWKVEQSILEDTVALLTSELELLNTALEELKASATATDEDRSKLNEEKDRLYAASSVIESNIGNIETKMKAIVKTLPLPLVERIKPLIRRMPENPADTALSIGERVQNIVGILSQADKFNATITQTSESREIDGGKTVEVRTLYWGLAAAYYVDSSGQYAGYGYPTADGWEWPRLDDAGETIKRLIDVYEGSGEIQFIQVPARIK